MFSDDEMRALCAMGPPQWRDQWSRAHVRELAERASRALITSAVAYVVERHQLRARLVECLRSRVAQLREDA